VEKEGSVMGRSKGKKLGKDKEIQDYVTSVLLLEDIFKEVLGGVNSPQVLVSDLCSLLESYKKRVFELYRGEATGKATGKGHYEDA
jgi:hypothetical protein